MARRGARVLDEPSGGSASSAWRQAVARARPDHDRGRAMGPPPEPNHDTWIREDDLEAPTGPVRSTGRGGPPRSLRRHRVPEPVVHELTGVVGAKRGPQLAARLAEASHAYDRERYLEALRFLRPLAEAAPGSAAVRELYGLTLYRLGRWRPAIKELNASRSISPSYDQLPVLMDCLRALRRYRDVAAYWDELREASPSAEVVAEGRIVMAGALADQGQLDQAISFLGKTRAVRKPREHHLRQSYALADLYERAGDIPRARDTFARIAAVDPDAFDVRHRLQALR